MSNKSKTKPKKVKFEVLPEPAPAVKLDLGCGRNKQAGYLGVDLYAPDADIKCNLFETPFANGNASPLWADDSVDEIFCSHFVEHIPAMLRWQFFEECWRILKPGGIMRIFVPSWKSERAYGDMTHQWPPVTAFALYYLSKEWREANKLTYGAYDLKCNFSNQAGPTGINAPFAAKAQEAQVFACTYYLEAYPDMWACLTKLPLP